MAEEKGEYLQRHDPDQTILVYNKIDLAQGTDPARRTDLSTNPMGTDQAGCSDPMGTDHVGMDHVGMGTHPAGSTAPAIGTDPAGMGTDPAGRSWKVIEASLINSLGVKQIRDAIRGKIEADIEISDAPHSTISERHYAALKTVESEISTCRDMLVKADDGWETLTASNLRTASEKIGEILGRSYHADLLENIFSKFCIGK
jgi:tRNA U34 5-carboxymethylaminomethyl modifying GTPase MnmE/TrmE